MFQTCFAFSFDSFKSLDSSLSNVILGEDPEKIPAMPFILTFHLTLTIMSKFSRSSIIFSPSIGPSVYSIFMDDFGFIVTLFLDSEFLNASRDSLRITFSSLLIILIERVTFQNLCSESTSLMTAHTVPSGACIRVMTPNRIAVLLI